MTSAAANPLVPAPGGSAEQSALCGGAVPSPGASAAGTPSGTAGDAPGRQPCNVFQAAQLLQSPQPPASPGGSPAAQVPARPPRRRWRWLPTCPAEEEARGRGAPAGAGTDSPMLTPALPHGAESAVAADGAAAVTAAFAGAAAMSAGLGGPGGGSFRQTWV